MADKKISALTGATTPLAGTEVLPIVQGGSTVKVPVSDLTTGRNVAVGAAVGVPRTLSVGGSVALERYGATPTVAMRGGTDNTVGYEYRYNIVQTNGLSISTATIGGSQVEYWFFRPNGNFELVNSNLVIGTAGKGIDFSANTHAAGMTSELLNDYEEGTWTPTVTAASGTITSSTATGNYTRIGRQVTLWFRVSVTNNGTGSGFLLVSNFPFAAGSADSLIGSGREVNNTNKQVSITSYAGAATLGCLFYDGAYPGSTGNIVLGSVTYFV